MVGQPGFFDLSDRYAALIPMSAVDDSRGGIPIGCLT